MHPFKPTKIGGTEPPNYFLYTSCCALWCLYFFHDDQFTFDNSLLELEIAGKGLLRVASEVEVSGISAFLVALSVQAGPGRCWRARSEAISGSWVSACVLAGRRSGAWSWPELPGGATRSSLLCERK